MHVCAYCMSMPLPAQQRGGTCIAGLLQEARSINNAESAPMAPSASFIAQKRRNAMAFRLTSRLCGLLVKAMRQLTQSVKVVTCAALLFTDCVRGQASPPAQIER